MECSEVGSCRRDHLVRVGILTLLLDGIGGGGPPDREGLRAASQVYGHQVDAAEFATLADRYGRWRGYWGHYLRVGG